MDRPRLRIIERRNGRRGLLEEMLLRIIRNDPRQGSPDTLNPLSHAGPRRKALHDYDKIASCLGCLSHVSSAPPVYLGLGLTAATCIVCRLGQRIEMARQRYAA